MDRAVTNTRVVNPVRFCLATIYTGAGIATLLLLNAGMLWIAFVFAVTYGLCIGGNNLLNASAWSNYYGRALVGSIRAVVIPVQVIALAAGPVLSGFLYDRTGSYTMPLTIFVCTFVASGVLFSVIKAPVKRAEAVARTTA